MGASTRHFHASIRRCSDFERHDNDHRRDGARYCIRNRLGDHASLDTAGSMHRRGCLCACARRSLKPFRGSYRRNACYRPGSVVRFNDPKIYRAYRYKALCRRWRRRRVVPVCNAGKVDRCDTSNPQRKQRECSRTKKQRNERLSTRHRCHWICSRIYASIQGCT
jgi:hypothetical protein